MSESAFRSRTEQCQHLLAEAGVDAIILFPSPNMYYLSGFRDEPMERHFFLFVTPSDSAFIAPELYGKEVREDSFIDQVWTWADEENPLETVEHVVDELSIDGGEVLVDDTMWAMFTQDLRAVTSNVTWGLASEILTEMRITKDGHEISALRTAAEYADDVSEEIRMMGEDAIGLTERELAKKIDEKLLETECSEISFDTIVGSGPNGAKPHHRHGDDIIEEGDPVVLDFGARYNGYPGDQTRTVVFDGEPPSGFEARYAAVREANEAGVQAVEPGKRACDIDGVVRDTVESHGFGDEFIHRTGHGVGLDVHEDPYIDARNERELETGMVFSIEPGVYAEGKFGIRIEDLVVVTADGCERLNHSPRTWKPL